MTTRTIIIAALAAAGLLSTTAEAKDPYDDPVAAELLAGWEQADGSRMTGLRLSLDPGWKTYWRTPGDAGIPPEFDWSGSKNVESIAIRWPTPKVFDQNGMRSIGYSQNVVIPFEIMPKRPGKPVHLKARMSLGVCADVCMPHSLRFEGLLDQTGARPTPAIAAALAAAPYSEAEAGVTSARCTLRPTQDGLSIEAHVDLPHAGGSEVVVIEPGRRDLWVSEARTQRQGGTLIAASEMIHQNGGTFSIDRSDVRITVIGAQYAVDVQGCTGG
ncbi:MAG: protein-disulfide reductase DsbD domain-containing protein [Pseudomonadota bacterium]